MVRKEDKTPEREEIRSIWGINRNDWGLFITMTAATAIPLIAAFIMVTLAYDTQEKDPSDIMFRLIIGIPAAPTAAATVSWLILSTKEHIMSLADKMRNETAKKQQQLRDEGRAQGLAEGLAKGQATTNQRILDGINAGQTIEEIRQQIIDDLEQNS